MEISVDKQGDVTIVAVVGSVDALTASALTAQLSELIAENNVRLVVDLSRVDYVSSAGLRTVLGALKESRSRGGDLRLAGAQPNVNKVLQMSGFNSILKAYPDVAAAVNW
jgi:anti-sigma B factor antagonist